MRCSPPSKDSRYLSDLMVKNPRAKSGYSQIDHVVLSPYGIFVIETKNYQGTIYGGKNRKTWLVNGKFKMMNPFVQNYGHTKAIQSYLDSKFNDLFILWCLSQNDAHSKLTWNIEKSHLMN